MQIEYMSLYASLPWSSLMLGVHCLPTRPSDDTYMQGFVGQAGVKSEDDQEPGQCSWVCSRVYKGREGHLRWRARCSWPYHPPGMFLQRKQYEHCIFVSH